ncbi:MAG: hypothetical protein JW891_04725 [Candidatus Lokiarchaeota archaeon]|nr:hypothetical protein [Candidatus Lokiarchaeota archaeon]
MYKEEIKKLEKERASLVKKCDTLEKCKKIECKNCEAFHRIEELEDEIEELEIKEEYHQKGLTFIKSTIKEKNSIPDMVLSPFGWEGLIQLDVWRFDSSNPEDPFKTGRATLKIFGEEIKQGHINAYNYIIENSEIIKKNMLDFLLVEYRIQQKRYEDLPDINTIDQLEKLITLRNIYIHNKFEENIAHVGYEFDCEWEIEHGLGFKMSKDRVLDCGHADRSY